MVIVPRGAFLMTGALMPGRGENPAIYINSGTKDLILRNWKGTLTGYSEAHPEEVIRVDWVAKRTCVFVKEHVFDWPLIRQCGVIWHEFGHAYNEMPA